MPPKRFYLNADQIRPIAEGYGACIASDRIVVDGANVGFCYREAPNHDPDSGWRFFAGDEGVDYMDDPENFAFYDVNTVANYDPEIIPLIKAPVGSAFERDREGEFIEVDYEPSDD